MRLSWYAIYCRCQFERSVHRGLQEAGFEVFYPHTVEASRWSDRVRHIERPLFPGYVFARFDTQNPLAQSINTVRGVVHILGTPADGPVAIPDQQIEIVRRVLTAGLNLIVMESNPKFEVGELVEVKHGPMTGYTGNVIRLKNQLRLVVSIQTMNRMALVEIDASALKPVKPAPKPLIVVDQQPADAALLKAA